MHEQPRITAKDGIISAMITLILSVAAGCGGFASAYYAGDWGIGWSVFAGIVCFGVSQGVLGFLLQKRVKREMEGVQSILLAGQKKLQQKMQRWQLRPPGSSRRCRKRCSTIPRCS